MNLSSSIYKKAHSLAEIDNSVRLDVPINADHEFFTDFSDVRGDFEDRTIYRSLNVSTTTFAFDEKVNRSNKQAIFLAGMRGSGKTSELAKISQKLHNPSAFFCVVCNLDDQDKGLDLNNMEYMDILIFQLERLFEDLQAVGVSLNESVLASLQEWFGERVEEVNKVIKKEGGFEVELKAETPSILSFLGVAAKIKANLMGSKENADKIRTVFKNNFTDFARKFNEFIEHVNIGLRRMNIAKELLFIIDGLEKVSTTAMRQKIMIEENNRFKQIKTYTIFTLPVELMSKTQALYAQSINVISFPFVKLRDHNGEIIEPAVARFMQFVYKRIDESLFDSPETVRRAILFGGGSPRELLRILEYASMFADENSGRIDLNALNKAIKKLAAQTSQYLTEDDLTTLKRLKEANALGVPVSFDPSFQKLMEELIVFEYNDGTYKRVNPLVEASELYKHYVK